MSLPPREPVFFDLSIYAIDDEDFGKAQDPPDGKQTRPLRPQRFLAGPLDWDLLDRAGALPGRALHLLLVLLHRRRLTRDKTRTLFVNLRRIGDGHGMGEWAARRALRALERAGLVTVSCQGGYGVRVTLKEKFVSTSRDTSNEGAQP
jgi:hypothetical protein